MVIILLIIACLALFASAMFIKQSGVRIVAVLVSVILLVGSTTLMVLNYHSHFGMKKVTMTTTKMVAPVAKQLPIALYQPLGTDGKEEVLLYRNNPTGKVQHTKADENITSKMKFANVQSPTMTVKKTRWQFKNNFYKTLFMWSGMNGTLAKQQTTITYPQEFVKVTPRQMRKMKSAMAASATSQAAQRQALAAAVATELAKHPQASAQQRQAIAQRVQWQLTSQMIKRELAQ